MTIKTSFTIFFCYTYTRDKQKYELLLTIFVSKAMLCSEKREKSNFHLRQTNFFWSLNYPIDIPLLAARHASKLSLFPPLKGLIYGISSDGLYASKGNFIDFGTLFMVPSIQPANSILMHPDSKFLVI